MLFQGHLRGNVLEHQVENPATGKQHDAPQHQWAVHQHQEAQGGADGAEQCQGGEGQNDLAGGEGIAVAVADFPIGVEAFREILHADQERQQVGLASSHCQCRPQGDGFGHKIQQHGQ